MSRILKFFAAALVLAFSFTSALATEHVTVPAGKTSAIGFLYFANGLAYGCNSSGKAKVTISSAPEHGTVRTEWRKLKANFENGCKGKVMNGLAVFYTPNPGFIGKDSVRVMMSVPGLAPGASYGGKANWTFDITVGNVSPAAGKSGKSAKKH